MSQKNAVLMSIVFKSCMIYFAVDLWKIVNGENSSNRSTYNHGKESSSTARKFGSGWFMQVWYLQSAELRECSAPRFPLFCGDYEDHEYYVQ